MNFNKTRAVVFFAIIFLWIGCTNRDQINKQKQEDALYLDYTVTAEESDENVTCVFQFKEGDADGKAVNITPAKVELDGQPIESDSAKFSGFYYEVQKPVDSFAGKHTIVYSTGDKDYKNEFEFFPFTLEEDLSAQIQRKPFSIQLRNFPSNQKSVRLLLLDTAFESTGFNDLVPVIAGKINIAEAVLKTVKNGPINLELYLEQEIPLKQVTQAGGKLSITYGLRREFELVD